MTREHTNSLLSGNVKYSYEINHSLMIKRDVTKNKESIEQLKDDSVFLLNDVESTLNDKPIENIRRNRNMSKKLVNVQNGAV